MPVRRGKACFPVRGWGMPASAGERITVRKGRLRYTRVMEGPKRRYIWKNKVVYVWRRARLHACCALFVARASLFPAAELRRLERMGLGKPGASEETVLACAGKWFSILERLGCRPSCLVRSVVLSELLRGESHPARVVFGVRRREGGLDGHCWVRVGERVVAGEAVDYQELDADG